MTRVCNQCKQELAATEFHKNSRAKDGLQNTCKTCRRKWALATREQDLQRYRQWYQEHKPEAAANSKVYKATHRDQVKQWNRDSRRKMYALDPEKHRWRAREYNRSNPAIVWQRHMRKLAEQWNCQEITAAYQDWLDILEQYGNKCHYCGRNDVKMHTEHKTPLARGGEHAKDNLAPACNNCNVKKGQLTEVEFREVLHRGVVGIGNRAQRIAERRGEPGPLDEGFVVRNAA